MTLEVNSPADNMRGDQSTGESGVYETDAKVHMFDSASLPLPH